ncbi:methyltransferase [Nocardia terpenica]|uniref:Methyltransferase n=2 Tax=Nocardia terpenica TaxID=455432 RepID=A0A161Z1X7_9NOCA|nr:methyltransferase [Nocardia terpenica]NQE86802.1 methyltransferase [Nocardia terpenica]
MKSMHTMSALHGDSLFSDMIWLLSGMPLAYMLQTIAELGIADELVSGPLSVEELAERTESDVDALYRVLRAVATRGVFTEISNRIFGLTEHAQILRSDVPNSLRNAFRMHGQKCMRDMYAETAYSVRTGKSAFEYVNGAPLFQYFAQRPECKELFDSFVGMAARRIQHAAIETYDLTGVRKLVDIGEMHGGLLASILTNHPGMRGVYADLPVVVPSAEKVLREAGVGDRVELVGGSYLESVPSDADVYLLPQLLHRLSDAEAVAVLTNIRQVISPTGRVLAIDAVLPEGDVPHLAKVLDSTQLLLGPIRDRTEAEFVEIFEKAGFRLVEITGRTLPAGVLVAVSRPRVEPA